MSGCKACVLAVVLGLAAQAQAVEVDKARAAERHYRAGVESMKSEAWDEAAEEFRAAIAADPEMVLAHYNLGQCRMAQRRYVEAVAAYRSTKDAFTRMGHLSEQDREEGERDRQDEIRGLRDNLILLSTIKDGSAGRRVVEIESRIRLLESMRFKGNQRPEMPAEFPLALGSAYFRQQKLAEAEAEYVEAARLNPKLGAAHNNLAVIYLMTDRPVDAESAIKRAEKSGFPVNAHLKEDIEKANAARKD
ncbi:MAG TPA: tetratricopeptide repeat protein [Vicinamibacteria bacterium]|nr:tetratricopeptide repeat protein [Vicinamibacteria bacterium]